MPSPFNAAAVAADIEPHRDVVVREELDGLTELGGRRHGCNVDAEQPHHQSHHLQNTRKCTIDRIFVGFRRTGKRRKRKDAYQ